MSVVITGTDAGGPVIFTQSTPAASWPIAHGLGHYPQVTVVDEDGDRLISDLAYGDINNITITHAAPLAGSAYLL